MIRNLNSYHYQLMIDEAEIKLINITEKEINN